MECHGKSLSPGVITLSTSQVLAPVLLVRDNVVNSGAAFEVEKHVEGADSVTLHPEKGYREHIGNADRFTSLSVFDRKLAEGDLVDFPCA